MVLSLLLQVEYHLSGSTVLSGDGGYRTIDHLTAGLRASRHLVLYYVR